MAADTRTVHAVTPITGVEVVRYDRAGKWWLEDGDRREPVTIGEAVDYAVMTKAVPCFGLCGGASFGRRLRAALRHPRNDVSASHSGRSVS